MQHILAAWGVLFYVLCSIAPAGSVLRQTMYDLESFHPDAQPSELQVNVPTGTPSLVSAVGDVAGPNSFHLREV